MLTKSFDHSISNASADQLREALQLMLRPHAAPVFGAAKTVEHEVAALNALKALHYIEPGADEFDLVEKLRITKSKARSLLYQAALRADAGEVMVNDALRKALETTQVVREGALYLIEVPDPLTMDRLRKRIRNYGFVSDGTFSGSIAKIPEGALIKLVEELIPDEHKTKINKHLIKSGLPDKTIKGAIKAILSAAGKKVAGELGDQAAKELGAAIGDVIDQGWEALQKFVNNKSYTGIRIL